MPNTTTPLDRLDHLVALLCQKPQTFEGRAHWVTPPTQGGVLHCPQCGELRVMSVSTVHLGTTYPAEAAANPSEGKIQKVRESCEPGNLTPSVFNYECLQCGTTFTALIYRGPEGPALAIFPSCYGGLRTRHTPESVAYYLDQAYRSQSVGANSAAVAMYRAALDHLLFEQGFTKGMCGKKIEALEAEIAKEPEGTAPKWAQNLDTRVLKVLKDLGNGSIHANDGEVTQQSALDSGVLAGIQTCFRFLLLVVYEAPKKKEALLTELNAASTVLSK